MVAATKNRWNYFVIMAKIEWRTDREREQEFQSIKTRKRMGRLPLLRELLIVALLAAAAAGCVDPGDGAESTDPRNPGQPTLAVAVRERVSNRFVGYVDPARGILKIRMLDNDSVKLEAQDESGDDGVSRLRRSLANEQLTLEQDGNPNGNTTASTVDIVTNATSLGSGTCEYNPSVASWGGDVRVGNYYAGYYLCNVWVEIHYITDLNHVPCDAPSTWPSVPSQLTGSHGAFYMGHTFTAHDGSLTLDSSTGYRKWDFKNPDNSAFNFHGRVHADRQATPCGPEVTIEGINYAENASLTGYYQIPPDPIGVAGPNHVVSVVNSSIEIFTKAGALVTSQALDSFFSPLSPQTGTFDPKVIYDQYEDRFLVVTLEKEDYGANHVNNESWFFLAVSATSDPTGAWYFTAIDGKEIISGDDYWVDYPGFAVGDDAVYITANMFAFTARNWGGQRLWIIDKGTSGGFYGGGTASGTRHDPFDEAGMGGWDRTAQPAHMFGTPPHQLGHHPHRLLRGFRRGERVPEPDPG